MAPTPKGWEMIRIVAALVGVATVAVILRFVARLKRRLDVAIDDYLCFAAMILLYGMFIELVLWCSIGGNGAHYANLSIKTRQNFWKIFLSNQFTYFVLCPIIKISIVCFYRRVFPISSFHKVSFLLNCLMGAWAAGIFFACAGQCRPLKAYWDKSIEGHCFDGKLFFIVNQVFNVVMDFVILGMPIPIIWGLQRAWQEKLELTAVFALGGFVCFASIYRIIVLFYINPADTTYTVYQATLWTHVEPSVGLICSCLPTIRGLFPQISRLKNSTNRSKITTWASTFSRRYATGTTSSVSEDPSSNANSTMPFVHVARGDAEYLIMSDVTVYGGKSLDSRSFGGNDHARSRDGDVNGDGGSYCGNELQKTKKEKGITVRTDINIFQNRHGDYDRNGHEHGDGLV